MALTVKVIGRRIVGGQLGPHQRCAAPALLPHVWVPTQHFSLRTDAKLDVVLRTHIFAVACCTSSTYEDAARPLQMWKITTRVI